MGKELTESDVADFEVTFTDGTAQIVQAAYVAIEDPRSGWLIFKDHNHKGVAHVAGRLVQMVTKRSQSAVPPRFRCEHLDVAAGPGLSGITCTICGPLAAVPAG